MSYKGTKLSSRARTTTREKQYNPDPTGPAVGDPTYDERWWGTSISSQRSRSERWQRSSPRYTTSTPANTESDPAPFTIAREGDHLVTAPGQPKFERPRI